MPLGSRLALARVRLVSNMAYPLERAGVPNMIPLPSSDTSSDTSSEGRFAVSGRLLARASFPTWFARQVQHTACVSFQPHAGLVPSRASLRRVFFGRLLAIPVRTSFPTWFASQVRTRPRTHRRKPFRSERAVARARLLRHVQHTTRRACPYNYTPGSFLRARAFGRFLAGCLPFLCGPRVAGPRQPRAGARGGPVGQQRSGLVLTALSSGRS